MYVGGEGSLVCLLLRKTPVDDALERVPNVFAGRQMGLLIIRKYFLLGTGL